MSELPITLTNKTGFHYFQDTAHYTNHDLNTWLPKLVSLNARWLLLKSDSSRAIPEQFIQGLVTANIAPIVHFCFKLPDAPSPADVRAILSAYAHWGIKYVILFDRPNQIGSWSAASWSQSDLVERFIDRFLPLANEAVNAGLTPVFPPLEPAGDYWDTSFLRSALESIKRRGAARLLQNMAFAATTYTFGHDLNWGEGGAQKWSQAKPYFTPANSEDQCGFNNFQWVEQIAKNAGVANAKIFQVGCGLKKQSEFYSPVIHAEVVQEMLSKIASSGNTVTGAMFYLLAAEPGSAEYAGAWYKTDGKPLPIVRALSAAEDEPAAPVSETKKSAAKSDDNAGAENPHPIEHYLLLPSYEWGVADWHLEVTRPFIIKHRPTVGYSITEAELAKKVTVIGGDQDFPPDAIAHLRNIGCVVEQIAGDGTSIASILAQR
jgi:hypothetical protein